MKKSIFALLFLLFSLKPEFSFEQNFLYFKTTLGGGFGINGSDYALNSYTYTDTNSFVNKSIVKFLSFGNELCPGIAVGHNFSKNFSFEININYIKRLPILISNTDCIDWQGQSFSENWEYKIQGHSFYLTPAFIISPNYAKFNPYFKIGFIIAKGSLKEVDSSYGFLGCCTQNLTHYADFYYGLKSAIGFDYPVSKRTKLFFEVDYDNISFSPTKTIMTECSSQGANLMGQMNVDQTAIVYVNEISSPSSPPDPNEPLQVLKRKLSLNSLTINVGLKFQ